MERRMEKLEANFDRCCLVSFLVNKVRKEYLVVYWFYEASDNIATINKRYIRRKRMSVFASFLHLSFHWLKFPFPKQIIHFILHQIHYQVYDDIASKEEDLISLVMNLDKTSSRYCMVIKAEKKTLTYWQSMWKGVHAIYMSVIRSLK